MPEHFLHLQSENYKLDLISDETYTPGSKDNLSFYDKEFFLPSKYDVFSKYGIACWASDAAKRSCIILAYGFSSLHESSAFIQNDELLVAVGNEVCCLKLPDLDLRWHIASDLSCLFGIYSLPQQTGIIAHGELEIARISMDGQIVWAVSGKDIFTGNWEVTSAGIEVTDFNQERYHFGIDSGQISLLPSE
ncbi:MAG TPA: hypothetical protein PK530_04385 [Anaerolineales bacterium]|nr:hypothetical protein [Anaerolineales bacterium]